MDPTDYSPSGARGNFFSLTFEQKKEAIRIVVDETRGRVPVYAGNRRRHHPRGDRNDEDGAGLGVSAVSVITPYFLVPSQKELIAHYTAIAKACPDLPILLYSNPDRTQVPFPTSTVLELAAVDNIVGVKDSSGDMSMTGEYIRLTRG